MSRLITRQLNGRLPFVSSLSMPGTNFSILAAPLPRSTFLIQRSWLLGTFEKTETFPGDRAVSSQPQLSHQTQPLRVFTDLCEEPEKCWSRRICAVTIGGNKARAKIPVAKKRWNGYRKAALTTPSSSCLAGSYTLISFKERKVFLHT